MIKVSKLNPNYDMLKPKVQKLSNKTKQNPQNKPYLIK